MQVALLQLRQEKGALGGVSYTADGDLDDARAGERAHGLHRPAQALGTGGKGHAGGGVDPRAVRAEDSAYLGWQLQEYGLWQVVDPGLGSLEQPVPVEATDGTSDCALAHLRKAKALDPARPVIGAVVQPMNHAQQGRELQDRLDEQQDRGGAGVEFAMAPCGLVLMLARSHGGAHRLKSRQEHLDHGSSTGQTCIELPPLRIWLYLIYHGWGFLCGAIDVGSKSHFLPASPPIPRHSTRQQ